MKNYTNSFGRQPIRLVTVMWILIAVGGCFRGTDDDVRVRNLIRGDGNGGQLQSIDLRLVSPYGTIYFVRSTEFDTSPVSFFSLIVIHNDSPKRSAYTFWGCPIDSLGGLSAYLEGIKRDSLRSLLQLPAGDYWKDSSIWKEVL